MRGESGRLAMLISALAMQGPPKEQPPGNSQVKELFHVSNLESGTAVPTDGDNRQLAQPGNRQASARPNHWSTANLSGFATEGAYTGHGIWLFLL